MLSSFRSAVPAGMVAICDDETGYAFHLMEYLLRRTQIPYEINVFTSPESLYAHAKPEEVVLLIISESEYGKGLGTDAYDPVLILNESDRFFDTDLQEEGSGAHSTPEITSKYQSMEQLSQIILNLIMKQNRLVPQSIRHGPLLKIIGVYTPVTRCLQTTFSLTLGQFLGECHKVLYLNFENYSGLDLMLGRMFKGSVADLLYYNECARDKVAWQLSSMVENVNGLDFIPPMRSFIELRAIRAEQWLSLFDTIEKTTEYEYLILDLSESTDGLLDILRACDEVYMIERDDALSGARIQMYELMLKENEYEDICLKLFRWHFPVFHELPGTLENLTHGDLYRFIQRQWKQIHFS